MKCNMLKSKGMPTKTSFREISTMLISWMKLSKRRRRQTIGLQIAQLQEMHSLKFMSKNWIKEWRFKLMWVLYLITVVIRIHYMRMKVIKNKITCMNNLLLVLTQEELVILIIVITLNPQLPPYLEQNQWYRLTKGVWDMKVKGKMLMKMSHSI